MKTISQQLNVKEFPFIIKDKSNNILYFEDSNGFWCKREFQDNNQLYYENSYGFWFKREFEDNKEVYYENSKGRIIDYRPKKETEMTILELEKLTGIKNLKIIK